LYPDSYYNDKKHLLSISYAQSKGVFFSDRNLPEEQFAIHECENNPGSYGIAEVVGRKIVE
jgi:hypothetical protein